jgi:hypothetical protein
MASFAELDSNNIVLDLQKVNDEALGNLPFPESEPVGIEFLQALHGPDKIYKQYSINTVGGVHLDPVTRQPDGKPGFRKNEATIGGKYDADRDAFVKRQPYPSWSFNETTCLWEPPSPEPPCEYDKDGIRICYAWDEEQKKWVTTHLGDITFVTVVTGVFPSKPSGSMNINAI